jgi:hypothetical protein
MAFGTATQAAVITVDNTTKSYGTLLTDNFNITNGNASTFSNNLAMDQDGLLSAVSYNVQGSDWTD